LGNKFSQIEKPEALTRKVRYFFVQKRVFLLPKRQYTIAIGSSCHYSAEIEQNPSIKKRLSKCNQEINRRVNTSLQQISAQQMFVEINHRRQMPGSGQPLKTESKLGKRHGEIREWAKKIRNFSQKL